MKSVLLITLEYPPQIGGIAEYLANLVEYLPTDKVNVLAQDVGDTHESDMASSAPVYRKRLLSGRIRPRWLPSIWWADWVYRRERPTMTVVSHILPIGRVARFLKWRRRMPYVVIVHGMDVALALSGGRCKRRLARRILQDATLVVANSSYTARFVESADVPKERIMILPPSPSFPMDITVTEEARAAIVGKHALRDTFSILSVGRLVARKGFADAIRAVAKLKEEGTDIRYVIVGDGPEREALGEVAKEECVEDRVVFAGIVPREELPAYYAATNAFVMASKSMGADIEGFGTVYLEANLLKKPVIGARAGGVPDAIAHEVSGLLVDPSDVGQLADAIRRLKDDPKLAARLGEQGRERVQKEFGWEKHGKRFAAAMKELD
ncbi:glycosyltransferase family 4 protein [Patescibacteria group bacterium]